MTGERQPADIVQRLRAVDVDDSLEVWEGAVLHEEAAAEIERLRAEIAADAAAIQAARLEGYCSTCGQDVG